MSAEAQEGEVSVLLCDDDEMRRLNSEYRRINAPTDVLSFGQDDAEPAPEGLTLLGDVVVSLETAARQAAERQHGLETEAVLLALHGGLHLLGYDDGTEEDTAVMIDKAEAVARRLGYQVGGQADG